LEIRAKREKEEKEKFLKTQNTFEHVSKDWLAREKKRITYKHAKDARRSLEMHVYPKIGNQPIDDISTKEIKSVLSVIQDSGKLETAHRVHQRIRSVFQFAVMNDLTERNPAADLYGYLEPVKKKSMKEENLDEKCWKGYEKKGMKTMFGKRYPNCVKKKVGESMVNWRDEIGYEGKDDVKKLSEDDMKGMSVKSGHKRPTKSGAGMTQKGVEAYRRRNPGSKLKTAVTTEPSKLKKGSKASNRRKSYCARSAGQMKKFPKAAKDPNSRLRQARRRWNC